MSYSPSLRAGPAPGPRGVALQQDKSFVARMLGLIQERFGANVLFLASIIIGFVHGWMKLHYRGAIITFAFDIPLTLALLVVIATAPKMGTLFPKGPVSTGLKFLVATCAIYGILPFGIPPLVAMAAFRGWCFIPLIFLLGYYLTTSLRQIEIFTYLLMGLGFATAIYGLRQSPAEIKAMIESDPYYALRLRNNFYGSVEGAQFRVFSTFVSAAAFGGTMAFCSVFALSRLAVPGCTWKERLLLLGITGPMAYCVFLSGSRTALVMLVLAFFFTGWYRKTLLQLAVPAVMVAAALFAAGKIQGNAVLGRFSSLLDFNMVHGRAAIVYGPAFSSLEQAPFGGGLGRSGHGVPTILGRLVQDFDWRPVDGDLGRLAVEMGIIGLIVFFGVLITGAVAAFKMLKEIRESTVATVGLPAGSWFIISAICMPIGSPFLSIPIGPLTWFFLGSLLRLHEEFKSTPTGGVLPMQNERLVSFIKAPRQTLYGSVKKALTNVRAGAGRARKFGEPAKPNVGRRSFLYARRREDAPVFQTAPPPAPKSNESRARRPRL